VETWSRQRSRPGTGALGVAETRRLPPGRHREETLVCVLGLFEAKCHINADAAAIDLACAQVDKCERPRRHAGLFCGLPKCLQPCMAAGTIIAGFFIPACMITLLLDSSGIFAEMDAEHQLAMLTVTSADFLRQYCDEQQRINVTKEGKTVNKYQIAQVNIGRIKAPLDHPTMSGFMGGWTKSTPLPITARGSYGVSRREKEMQRTFGHTIMTIAYS